MHVLLATNHYFAETGSEVAIATLARALVAAGLQVSFFCPHVVEGFVRKTLPQEVRFTTLLETLAAENFDVAHVQHGPVAIQVRSAFPSLPMVLSSQGVLPFLEQPPPLELGVGSYLSISSEVTDNLLAKGVDAERVDAMPNFVEASRFVCQAACHYPPRKVLVISNRLDAARKYKLRQAAERIGAEIRFVGGDEAVSNQVLPAIIGECDLVVSLGRGAIEAMLAERPVVIYDYLGGDGAVTPDNYAQIRERNFSGRTLRKEFSVEELAEAFQSVQPEQVRQLAEWVREDYAIEVNLHRLLDVYRRCIAAGTSIDANELRQVRYIAKAMVETLGWERQVLHRPLGCMTLDNDSLLARRVSLDDARPPIGVVIHAYYLDGLDDILAYLGQLDAPLHLYVTCVPGGERGVLERLQNSAFAFSLFRVQNRGRDVLPFLRVLPRLRQDGVEFLVKVHTKKSLHMDEAGERWADELFASLLEPMHFRTHLQRLTDDLCLHISGPEHYRLPISQYLRGNNQQHLRMLAGRARLSEERVMAGEFYAGTMFFARVASLSTVTQLGLEPEDFEEECGQLDGTLAHALERFFRVLVQDDSQADRATLYRKWLNSRRLEPVECERLAERLSCWAEQPSFLMVVRDHYPEKGLITRTLESLDEQLYPPGAILVLSDREPEGIEPKDNLLWLPIGGDWIAQLNEVLPQVEVDWFQLLRAGDVLDPHALLLLADRAIERPSLCCCYTDEDRYLPGSGEDPVFKPDFNLDMLRSYPYVGRGLAFRREAFLECGGFALEHGELAPHDLLLRLVEQRGLASIGHIAEVLLHQHEHLGQWILEPSVVSQVAPLASAHLQRLGVPHAIRPGALRMINRITYGYPGQPLVSIVIPTKNQLPMLRRCVESLLRNTRYHNFEILVVDNASDEPEALAWLAGLERMGECRLRVLRYPHPFNFSAINNFAAEQAHGDYLVLLNNDTAIFESSWLEAMLNHARRPEVGIVGAKLYYPDGRIQHGGVVLGLRGVADHPYVGEKGDAKGYMQRLQIDQNYTAVTAACMMVRRSVYFEVGGMDEAELKVSYNDVDFCLKVADAGYLTVWTPYAAVMHEANVSQSQVDKASLAAKAERFRGEQQVMYRRWLPRLAADPAYNKNLSLDGAGFALDHRSEVGWQPFAQTILPRVICHAADPYGCGHYRVIQPFTAMHSRRLIGGALSEDLLSVVELERIRPDSIVFQRQIFPAQLEAMRNTKAHSDAFRVYELDDYIIDLPQTSPHRKHIPRDIETLLRKGLAFSDRFVVSCEAMAEAFHGWHPEIRVVANRLPLEWWGNARSLACRRVSRKPRVGWAGGVSHGADLELIVEVVKALANEVEWVFMGMCPAAIRPYIHEFHTGVHIAEYPARLARLNLDLALAPLENNRFNECKSNLRLLEYGACGFPVVCSDILCYRGDLPVTRVGSAAREWIEAIRMHLADPDASERQGDELHGRVLAQWMLEGEHLDQWARAWLPD